MVCRAISQKTYYNSGLDYTYVPVKGVRVTTRGICTKDGMILVVKRLNKGERYMVLPGGGINEVETPLEVVEREFLEETSVVVKPVKIIGKLDARPGHNSQFIMKEDYVFGEPKLDPESSEFAQSIAGENFFEPVWVSIDQARLEVVPEQMRQYF